ncbi:hypothetical protein AB4Z22_17060, partial [Paenibacillus sp. TAF58]
LYDNAKSKQTVILINNFGKAPIESIFIATPIGEFYSASYYRNQAFSFYDSDLFARAKASKDPFWVERHEDLLFQGKDRVISLVMRQICTLL